MKKITILALHLGYGGIERSLISLANMLSFKYEVEILSTYQVLEKPAFPINESITIKYLLPHKKPNKKEFKEALYKHQIISILKEGMHSLNLLYLRKKEMVKAIKECESDVIISTRILHNNWLGKYGRKETFKIGWEHNYHNQNQKFIKKVTHSVQKLDRFVLVSKELKEFYEPKASCKCVYIPNTISHLPNTLSSCEKKKLISVGRLEKEKGFCDLMDVFSLFQKESPDWTLEIIGDGFERSSIEEKIKQYHLENQVSLSGMQTPEYIEKAMLESSIYVLPSFSESFGIVILEAYSCGLPVVAFDSASGARNLVKDGKTGYLISNREKESMKEKLTLLANNKNLRKKMGKQAREESKLYLEETVKEQWYNLVEEGK